MQSNIEEVIIQQRITKINGQTAYKKYLRGKLLGKGGFAKCYEGINLQSNQKYAIKVIQKASLHKNRAKQKVQVYHIKGRTNIIKILTQIKIHKTLHYKHIVELDSYFQDHNNVYIVLELCTNKTLSEMVKRRKRLTPPQTRYLLIQIIKAIQYMHNSRIIHRDLKLGNIFLNDNMLIKVGDFGLATKLEFIDQKKRTLCGTPNYIAPEIVEGSVGHSYEVDIWSTGVICYAFLFGRPPFQTNDIKMTYKRIKTCDYDFPSIQVPQDAKNFIRNVLVIDPKKRMSIKEMLQHPFLNNQDIPSKLSNQCLNTTPVLKRQRQSIILPSKDIKIIQGINSPRQIFNEVEIKALKNRINKIHSDLPKKKEQRGQQHKINIMTYVDYSKKYGLGYLINNHYYGVYFNDQTLISTNSDKKLIYYLQCPSSKDQKIDLYTYDTVPTNHLFKKKTLLLERFIINLNDELNKLPQKARIYQNDSKFVYVKQWFKTKHAIMFGLSNKLFQVNFFDNSQILLQTTKKTVYFTSKQGESTYDGMENQMTRRIKYTKEILNSLRKKNIQKNQEEFTQNM